jgi:CubicO group peptidase (beta-lactamase class C family)
MYNVRRRDLVRLLGTTGVGTLLASCVAAPAASTRAPPLASATPGPPTAAPPTPTSAPTAALPTPTVVPPTSTSVPPTAVPTLVPTPPELAAAVEGAMTRAIQRGVQPGGVVVVRHRGVQIMHAAFGLGSKFASKTTRVAAPIDATTDTLYDLASLTKLFTTTAVMRLVEQGRLSLDEPVARSLPEFAANGKASITLRHLLTHTAGLPDHQALWQLESTPEARLARVLRVAPLNPPGAVFRYSDLGLIALGHLVEQVAGTSLDHVIQDMVTAPLKLESVIFRPPEQFKRRVAPTEDESNVGRGMVWGEVHDENAWSLGGIAGHAGLFATAADVARFGQAYLDGGVAGDVRILRAGTVAEMTRNQIGGLDWRGLGWELNADYYMGHLASPQTYGHTGFTGTSLVVDPRRELVVVLLANRVHPTRDGPSQNPLRQALADAAMAAADAA